MIGKGSSRSSRAAIVTSVIAVVAALRLGRDFLVPLALAVLLSFLLAPLVIRLQRFFGRIASVILVTVTAFSLLVAIGWLVTGQMAELAAELPAYKSNIQGKITSLRETLDDKFGRVSRTVGEISKELAADSIDARDVGQSLPIAPAVPPPAPKKMSASPTLTSWAGSLVAWLGDVAIVIAFVIVILITYDDLRDRILKLAGTGRLNVTTQALNDAAGRVSRYLLMQTILNVCHGVLVGIGLYFIGLPAALFWGLTSALLRFIPYLGPLLAAALPIALALAVFDNWTSPLLTIGFFIVLEVVSNNVLEPWLYGSSTGLSPLAVIVAAVFWSWLWGAIGLVLSAPLTVCLVVLGKHVAQLHFLNIILSDDPVLDPKDRLYQRLLAMDQESALEIAETYLEVHTLEEVYENVLLPALAMSELDRHRGDLEDVRENFILESMKELIQELGEADQKRETALEGKPSSVKTPSAPSTTPVRILCLPARNNADELAGMMFAQLLERDGHQARCLSETALAGEMLDVVHEEGTQIVCISAVPPSALAHAKYLRKRLQARFETLHIVIGLWTRTDDPQRVNERVRKDEFVQGVTSLAAGRELVRQLAPTIVIRSSAESRMPSPSR